MKVLVFVFDHGNWLSVPWRDDWPLPRIGDEIQAYGTHRVSTVSWDPANAEVRVSAS